MKGLTLEPHEQTRIDVLGRILRHEITIGEASELLGIGQRQVWRLLAAYRTVGVAGLVHGNRGRRPVNALPAETRDKIIGLAEARYVGANFTHLAELLAEREGILVSRSTVRSVLLTAGVRAPRTRQLRCRLRRERLPREGMLLQIDGSQHSWLGGDSAPLVLLLAVDDATGTIPHALFRRQEDLVGYFALFDHILRMRGRPMAVYSDRNTIFWPLDGSHTHTQFGRAMRELGIAQVFARSPQAKGRVERIGGVLQDRFAVELRLAQAASLEEANAALWEYLPKYNQRFGVEPHESGNAYRPVPADVDLAGVLCVRHMRVVARDHTIKFRWRTLQLRPGSGVRLVGREVAVQERLDGAIVVTQSGHSIEASPEPGRRSITLAARLASLTPAAPGKPVCSVAGSTAPEEKLTRSTRRQQEWWFAVQSARSAGLSVRAIARDLGIARNTVRKYVRQLSPPIPLEPSRPD